MTPTDGAEVRPFRIEFSQAVAAMEVPGLFVDDVRAFFRGLR